MNTNRPINIFIAVLCIALSSCAPKDANQTPGNTSLTSDLYDSLAFDMSRVPEPGFQDHEVSVTDFGAVPGGQVLNTEAFNKAIDALAAKGGGTVVIPRGIWRTGPITLRSNINLHAEYGALVVFSDNFDDYPLVQTSFEGLETWRCLSPINGRNLENVAITGRGVFDGSGAAWRPVKRSKLTASHWKRLVASGGVLNAKGDIWYPSESSRQGAEMSDMNVPPLSGEEAHTAIKDFLRPVMVSLVSCKNVLLEGPTFQNSPAWCLHPLMCENITLRNVTVKNPWYSQNGDGLDLESCRNAIVYKCSFDVGDDAICIKSGKNEDGRKRGIPTENVIIKECIVYHGHGGFTVGSEMSGGVKNIQVSDLTFIGTDVGLRFKSTRGRGGVVENIYISDVNMIDIPAEAILFDLYYTGNSPIPEGDEKVSAEDKARMAAMIPPVTEETPAFKNIHIKNVVCRGAGRAVLFQGLPEMNLQNMNMENVQIEAAKGLYCIDADRVNMKNVHITATDGPAMYFYNSKNVLVDGFEYGQSAAPVVKVLGDQTQNLSFRNGNLGDKEQVVIGASVANGAVSIQ